MRDIEVINVELMLADLEQVTKRRERLAKDIKRGDKAAAAREKGLYRMEGKEHVVANGDVLLFKFNV